MPIGMQIAEERFVMKEIRPVRDIADFQSRWPEFRPSVLDLLQLPALNARQAEVVGWMIDLIDRIGAGDIAGN